MFTIARSIWPASTSTNGTWSGKETVTILPRVEPERIEGAADELVDRPELRGRVNGTHFQPRKVEEVRNQSVEALRLEPNRSKELRPFCVVQSESRALEPLRRSFDCRERGTQVMADRAQEIGLRLIAPPERLGFHGLLRQLGRLPLALLGFHARRLARAANSLTTTAVTR